MLLVNIIPLNVTLILTNLYSFSLFFSPGVTISVVLRDQTSREVIPGSMAVILLNDRIREASTNNTLIKQLVDLGFPEPDLTQVSISSPLRE